MKFKKIPKEYFAVILDRLSRFEPAHFKFERVVDDIVNKFSLDKKAKDLSIEEKIELSCIIFNSSIKEKNDFYINELLADFESKYFENNISSYQYLSSRYNISSMLDEITYDEIHSKNLFWLKKVNDMRCDLIELREKYSLLYPIEKIILCEGQTEFTLLNQIFKLFNYDLDKKGVMVLPAGGKNQVARKYYKLIEYTKTPFFVLLDKDANAIKELIEPKLRKIDDIYIINSGEFEDLIPVNILKNAINQEHSSEINCVYDDFFKTNSMVENLELIYKKYGFGEFKKAHFANILNKYIKNNTTCDDFFGSEILDILEKLK